jgi:excisionase family DNA binding protein
MEDTLTVFKASKFCNVSSKTIINWIEAGHIKAYKTVGGHRRIKRNDMEGFMRRQGIPIPEAEPRMNANASLWWTMTPSSSKPSYRPWRKTTSTTR